MSSLDCAFSVFTVSSACVQAIATVVLVILTAWYAWRTHCLAQSAERQTRSLEKQSTSQLLFELYRTYNTPEMQEAIRDINTRFHQWRETLSEADLRRLNEKRYHFGQRFWEDVQEGDETDKRRRKLTHFWYQVGFLLEQEIINLDWACKAFGPPIIVDILEPIEVILADEVISDPNRQRLWKQRQPWPPMCMLKMWKSAEHGQKSPLLQEEVPPDDMIPVSQNSYQKYRQKQEGEAQ